MPVTHAFVNPQADGPDPTVTRPSDWNALHVINVVNADVDPAAAIDESKLNLNFPTHAAVTIGAPANGLTILGQVISLGLASALTTGALSSADWSTFNSKQNALTFPLAPNLGGTGVANAVGSTLTLGGATTISTGGTIALGGFTLTVPATGTAALLATANVFTANQTINVNSTAALLVEQDGVFDDLFVVDTTNGRVTVGGGNAAPFSLFKVHKNQNAETAFRVENGTSDTAGRSSFYIATNANQRIEASIFSSGYTSSGLAIPSSGLLYVNGVGGFAIGAASATGVLKLFSGGLGGANVRVYIDSNGKVAISDSVTPTPATTLHVRGGTTTTNAVLETLRVEARVTTAATGSANGFGTGQSFYAETATDGTNQQQGLISTAWVDATNATRKALMTLSAFDTAQRDGIKIEANGTSADIRLLGDTWWEGEGFGLPYGSFYGNDIAWTQAGAVQNTWYEVSDADIADGQLNLITHDGNGKLTVAKGGRYRIDYQLVAECSVANKQLQSGLSVSGTEQNDGIDHEVSLGVNQQMHMGSTAILDLAANATLEVSMRTTDAGAPDITVEHINLSMVMVGGT